MSYTPWFGRSGPKKSRGVLSTSARAMLAGGLAAGTAFAGFTGIASATTGSSPAAAGSGATVSSASVGGQPAKPSARPGPPGVAGPGLRGGPGRAPGGGPGRLGGPGAGGTITAINGSTLTLRTMNGTETVDTSSSTTYSKEMQTISLSDLAVGDVVHVAGTPAAVSSTSSSSSSTPPQPGTGKLDATVVTVVEPSFVGRVTYDSDGTLTLVGPDGQLLTVSTIGSTRYYNGTSRTSASAVSDGDHVMAEGFQTSITHLDADLVILAPTPPVPTGT